MNIKFKRVQSTSNHNEFEKLYSFYKKGFEEEVHLSEANSWRQLNSESKEVVLNFFRAVVKESSKHFLMVCMADDEPIGYGLSYIKECPGETPSEIGYINGVYVLPEFRRMGIAQRCLDQMIDWFKLKNVDHIELYTAIHNEAAIGFWKRNNFLVNELVMVRTIKAGE